MKKKDDGLDAPVAEHVLPENLRGSYTMHTEVRVGQLDLFVGDEDQLGDNVLRVAHHGCEPGRALEVTREELDELQAGLRGSEAVARALGGGRLRLRRRRIARPAGSGLAWFARFMYRKNTYADVFEPQIRDLLDDWIAAYATGRRGLALWVRVRAYYWFAWSMVEHAAGATVGRLVRALSRLVL